MWHQPCNNQSVDIIKKIKTMQLCVKLVDLSASHVIRTQRVCSEAEDNAMLVATVKCLGLKCLGIIFR